MKSWVGIKMIEQIKQYYEVNVKEWVELAKSLHDQIEGGEKDIGSLVADTPIKDVDSTDVEIIAEYIHRLDVLERDYVWEDSKARPPTMALVVSKAFLDQFNNDGCESGSYVDSHYDGNDAAKKEIHNLTTAVSGLYSMVDNALQRNAELHRTHIKEGFARLIRGLVHYAMMPEINTDLAYEVMEQDERFKKEVDHIQSDAEDLKNDVLRGRKGKVEVGIGRLSEKIDPDYIKKEYGKNPAQLIIMENLQVGAHLVITAAREYMKYA